MEKKICCICGREFEGWGNNPYPVVEDEDARCCDDCNIDVVVPARLMEMMIRDIMKGGSDGKC